MDTCDICGEESDLVYATIEGTTLHVCSNCAKYGTNIKKTRFKESKTFSKREKQIETVNPEFSPIIKKARESKGLKQKEVSKILGIKESRIHAFETGHTTPNIEEARKLEKFFHTRLVEFQKEEEIDLNNEETKNFTLGDMIKKKQ